MKPIFGMGLALVLMGTTAHAQAINQANVIGPSGQETYSVQVSGANGVVYNCRPDIVDVEGVATRYCLRSGATAANAGEGTLFSGGLSGGAVAGVGLAVLAIAVIAGDGNNSSTTTTSP